MVSVCLLSDALLQQPTIFLGFLLPWTWGISSWLLQQSAAAALQSWVFFGGNDAKAETPVLWPPHAKVWLWCWEGLGAGGKGDDRGWDGWMASPTRWTWVWVNSRSWWWTGMPGVLWFMGSQRVGHDWVAELNWTELLFSGSLPLRPLLTFVIS